MKQAFVYMMTNKSATLYTGVTNDLERRVWEHKIKAIPGFTSKYKITKLVWFESTNDMEEAILFEKRIKGWKRDKKIVLIESMNPEWNGLAADWYSPDESESVTRDPSVARAPSG